MVDIYSIPMVQLNCYNYNGTCPVKDGIDSFDYNGQTFRCDDIVVVDGQIGGIEKHCLSVSNWKPYLRPMSSMTEEEIAELTWLSEKCDAIPTFKYVPVENYRIYDWMNRHHFDYRGLIEKGLALVAPEGM